jgi:ABC-2 type transport system ATP-binding protein
MDDDVAIKFDHVNKTFRLPREKNTSIKSAAVNFYRRNKGYEEQKVVENISFEVKKGEFFGIVGRNGSGKSTLLKLLAGIYTPDNGLIQVNGKLTPFIELGVGFNAELSGRENIFLNGALLGFSRAEMQEMYDDIVSFAELEKFMDQKLKNYSSGMQVRLAFSIAIRAESEILVLDEVLAVGDEAFQQKCMSVFEQYKARHQTIVLVTHDMSVVERFCDRAMLIKNGAQIVKMGSPRIVSHMYSESNKDAYSQAKQREEDQRITDNINISILDPETKQPKKRFFQGDEVLVRLAWKRDDVKHAGVALYKQSGEYIFGPNTYKEKQAKLKGHELYYLTKLDVGIGEYYFKAGLFGPTDKKILEFVDNGPSLIVEGKSVETAWEGIIKLDHAWGEKDNLKL